MTFLEFNLTDNQLKLHKEVLLRRKLINYLREFGHEPTTQELELIKELSEDELLNFRAIEYAKLVIAIDKENEGKEKYPWVLLNGLNIELGYSDETIDQMLEDAINSGELTQEDLEELQMYLLKSFGAIYLGKYNIGNTITINSLTVTEDTVDCIDNGEYIYFDIIPKEEILASVNKNNFPKTITITGDNYIAVDTESDYNLSIFNIRRLDNGDCYLISWFSVEIGSVYSSFADGGFKADIHPEYWPNFINKLQTKGYDPDKLLKRYFSII